jgi:hypothetical protein
MSWNQLLRTDGVRLEKLLSGRYLIVPPDARPFILACPCCARNFGTPEEAQKMADVLYPDWEDDAP